MSENAQSAPQSIPTNTTSSSGTQPPLLSPPINPSKLNQTPSPLPASSENNNSQPTPPQPLRSPTSEGLPGTIDSAYLDTGVPEEPSSHPTIAETGEMAKSSQEGPGPMSGQLKRVDKDAPRRIVRLGSLGGEGLIAKPPQPLPGESVSENAIVEDSK